MKTHIIRDSGTVTIGKTTYNIPEGYTNEEVEAAILKMKTYKGWTDKPYIMGRAK